MGFNQSYLYKDISQIPINFSKIKGNSAEIVSYCSEDMSLNEDNCVFINLYKGRNRVYGILACFGYVLRKGRNIEVLNLYHWRTITFLLGLTYKFINKNGLLYVKLDNDFESFKKRETLFRDIKNGVHKVVLNYMQKVFLRKVDLISTETIKGYELLGNDELFSKFKNKIYLITNGFYRTDVLNTVRMDRKRKVFTTSGRMGSYPKNSELFVEVLKRLELKDWRVNIIGTFENDFEHFFNKNVVENKKLCDKVNVYKWIKEKDEYYELLKTSSVFCITSRTESFCIAAIEALACGNYIITTDILASNDITNYGEFGEVILQDDIEGYVKIMQSIIDGKILLKDKFSKCVNYANIRFNWEQICLNLYKKMIFIKNGK